MAGAPPAPSTSPHIGHRPGHGLRLDELVGAMRDRDGALGVLPDRQTWGSRASSSPPDTFESVTTTVDPLTRDMKPTYRGFRDRGPACACRPALLEVMAAARVKGQDDWNELGQPVQHSVMRRADAGSSAYEYGSAITLRRVTSTGSDVAGLYSSRGAVRRRHVRPMSASSSQGHWRRRGRHRSSRRVLWHQQSHAGRERQPAPQALLYRADKAFHSGGDEVHATPAADRVGTLAVEE